MKYITVKLTESQANECWQAIENNMEDYLKEWQSNATTENERVSKRNAYLQRISTKFKQALAKS